MTSFADTTCPEPPANADESRLADFLDAALERLIRGEAVEIEDLLGDRPDLTPDAERLLKEVQQLAGLAAGLHEQERGLLSDLLFLSSEEAGKAATTVEGSVAPPDPFPGEFRVVRRLGSGAFGTVWQAEDLHLGRQVALKTVCPPGARRASDECLSRLREEARLLAAVRHRNVVEVYAWRQTPEAPPGEPAHWLVLQCVPGGSLAGRVRNEGPLAWQQASRYVADVAEGLLEVHARGIVHRDVKPSNILWNAESDEALLTDFGISVRLSDSSDAAGTPLYMPPEAFRGEVGPAQDVFGLAASLFWLVTGSVPFPARTRADLTREVRRGLPDPDPRCAELPAALEQLIRAGLAYDHRDRPSLRDFVTALRSTLNQLLADSLLLPGAAQPAPVRICLTVSRQVERSTFMPVATVQPPPERVLRDLRRVPPSPERVTVRTGERLRVEVEADRPGFVTLFNVGPTGNLNLLTTNGQTDLEVREGFVASCEIKAGRPLRVMDVELTPPPGRERLFALWTREPLPLRPRELLTLAEGVEWPASGPYRATRDMVRVHQSVQHLGPEQWHAVVLELTHHAAVEDAR